MKTIITLIMNYQNCATTLYNNIQILTLFILFFFNNKKAGRKM